MVDVLDPLPCMKPCNASRKAMVACSMLFMIGAHISQTTSTIPIPMHSPLYLGIITMIVHSSAIRMQLSRNTSFVTLTSLYHRLVYGSFNCVASLRKTLKWSALIPNGPPDQPVHILHTDTKIYPPYGGTSIIIYGCSSIGISSTSGGCRL